MRYKLIAFDMDGTLVVDSSCWRALHEHFKTDKKAIFNLKAYEKGEIDYPEFMRRDILLWQPLPGIDEVKKILLKYKLVPNAKEVLGEIHRRGYNTAIVTGGIDLLADEVGRDLGIKNILANGLQVDVNGKLTGEGIFRVEPNRKDELLKKIAAEMRIDLSECVAVGDSKYDRKFLEVAGLGVAIGRDHHLLDVADVVLEGANDLHGLLDHI